MDVQVYAREDGLWDVDATLSDVRSRETRSSQGMRPAGSPIHDMTLRLVVNAQLGILQAGSESRAVPYRGLCERVNGSGPQADADADAEPAHPDVYARLVGLNLLRGFRQALRERIGGIAGCTHLSELAQVLPTAVVQALAGEVIDTRGTAEGASQPFQIDRCHALRSDGDAVRMHYPRWYLPPSDTTKAADTYDTVDAATLPAPHIPQETR